MNAFTCAAVAPVVGTRPGKISGTELLLFVTRMKLPACHEPLMVFLSAGTLPVLSPISAHQGALAPALFPGETAMARWNSGEPVVSGSASVFPFALNVALIVAAPAVFRKLMPALLTWRMSLPVTVALNVPDVPGRRPIPPHP